MRMFGVIPVSSVEVDTFGVRHGGTLEALVETRIDVLAEAMPGSFAVFTGDSRLAEVVLALGWPLLERPEEKEPSGTVSEAIKSAFASSEADVLAWVSPLTPLFDVEHTKMLIDSWESCLRNRQDTLIAKSLLRSYAFLDGSELNFQSDNFDLRSKEVLPIEYTNLPFSLISKDSAPPYSVIKPNSQSVIIPEWAMHKVRNLEDVARLQEQGLL